MMKIRQMAWSNYRRMPDAQIDVRNHLVLVGPNDSGKSSILRALHMTLGMAHSQVATAITPRDFTDETQPLLITVTLDGIDDDDRAAFPDEITVGPPEVLLIQLEATLDPADPDQKTVRRTFPDSGHQRGPTREQLATLGFEYVPAARSLIRELGGGAGGAMRSLLSGLDLAADVAAFEDAAMRYRDALDGSVSLGAFRVELASALSDALPVPVPADHVRVVSSAEALEDPLAGVTVTVREGDRDIPLADQSDGVRALSVLTLLNLAHKPAKIVAVDEPETHLHSTAQRSIARGLMGGDGQRILATHSPSIAREVDPLDILAFRADRSAQQLGPDAAIAATEASVRHWNINLIDPLTARHVVVVEGVADRIVLEGVGRQLGMDLNRVGVAVVELGGADLFRVAYRLFGPAGFGIPLSGLLDADARTTWAQVVGVDPAGLEASGFRVCDPDLEATYIDAVGVPAMTTLLLQSPLITEASMLRACGAEHLAGITRDQLHAYCGHKRRKVASALAVAAGLDPAQAGSLTPVVEVLQLAAG